MKLILLGVLLTLALPVFADQQWCHGTLSNSYVWESGGLYIRGSWAPNWTQVCHLSSEWKGVSAAVCQEWHSMIQAAVVSRSPVTVYYYNAPPCDQLPSYGNAPEPSYFMLKNQ